jgi:hypothetical protein
MTGKTDGTCAFVQSGTTHGSDCPGSAKCNAARTGVTPAPSCNGDGACAAAADASCGAFACNVTSNMCETTCSTAAQCASADYCTGGLCKSKVTNGTLCSSNAQCTSGVCGGRCCAQTPCTCPQPSAGNVIKNPGFDKDLSGWTVDAGSATINWQPGTFVTGNGTAADGQSCDYSGAAYIAGSDPASNSQNIWQCVAIKTQTDYNFGVQQATLTGAYAHCALDLYPGPGCTGGNPNNVADIQWLNVAWSLGTYPTMFNSGFDVSAKVYCYVEMGGAFFFDNIYITPQPGMY